MIYLFFYSANFVHFHYQCGFNLAFTTFLVLVRFHNNFIVSVYKLLFKSSFIPYCNNSTIPYIYGKAQSKHFQIFLKY